MAPIATPVEKSQPAVTVSKTFGNYKDQAPGAKNYNKKLEEEGDADHPAAKVPFALLYDSHWADRAS